MIIIKMILGMKDETVSPYKDEISKCFLLGLISSSVTFNIIIAAIRPIVKNQNNTLIEVIIIVELSRCVIDCNQ
jgi:hypothetical protein